MADLVPVRRVITEIINGDSLTLGQAAKLLPAHRGKGEHADTSSVWRWATAGAKDSCGQIVKLEVAKYGGRHLTSRYALARFSAAHTAPAGPPPADATPEKPRTAAARQKSRAAASARMKASGA